MFIEINLFKNNFKKYRLQFATHQRHRSSQPSLSENPLRMLRSGNLPMIKPRMRMQNDARLIHPSLKTKSLGREDKMLANRNSADFDTRSEIQNGE